jgi:HlyD family type I secretion membrane fusion protein
MNNNLPTPATDEKKLPALAKTSATLVKQVDKLAEWFTPLPQQMQPDSPEYYARRSIRLGMWMIALVFGIFGLWSAFAPLNSAAIATGKVILDSNKKTIQHLEGGIVDAILVKEGKTVNKGDVLIRLDETTAKARYDLLRKQYLTLKATEARLIAERDDMEHIVFPEDLLEIEANEAAAKESLENQRRLFESRQSSVKGKIAVLKQRIEQFKDEINGLSAQAESNRHQIEFVTQEIQSVAQLVAQKNAPRSRLLALQRQKAALEGEYGEAVAGMSRAKQSIGEAEIEIINTSNTFLNQVNEEFKETLASLSDVEERIRASEDMFTRINILAPITGRITDLQVHTVGGVIKPGEKLMDIIPQDDILIVEAMVQPQDIDVVREGLEASVRLTAYKARFVPPIKGKVTNVSADRFDDPQRAISYYKARVVVDRGELDALKNVELYPGMPTDVLIVTGERTLLQYLFAPIRESFSKSFRED